MAPGATYPSSHPNPAPHASSTPGPSRFTSPMAPGAMYPSSLFYQGLQTPVMFSPASPDQLAKVDTPLLDHIFFITEPTPATDSQSSPSHTPLCD
ncbi:hypothetical protein AVEN_167963-1 [Araneus ventricosus]|uniref:Uncharacterized protein n=1 Tax=Araneus ventricosus TaxID=182803 RepID=A0A4Y2X9G1_ARAVE|nr:hypothetical protein AVEN_167963-1 [Araneus ventricosus]